MNHSIGRRFFKARPPQTRSLQTQPPRPERLTAKKPLFCLIVLASILLTPIKTLASESIAVIGNQSLNIESLSNQQIKRIFLGKSRFLPNNDKVRTVNINIDDPLFERFLREVLNKSVSQYNSSWSRAMFSGRVNYVPTELQSIEDIKLYVSNNPDAIGYIPTSEVDNSVRVLFSTKLKTATVAQQ